MGRRRTEEDELPEGKRTKTRLTPIDRETHPEPWEIMERLITELPIFAELTDASFRLFWADWQPDIDGMVTGAQCDTAKERERNLAEANGSTVDLIVMLPHDVWPTLEDIEKEHRIYHELRHLAQAKDSKTGLQNFDEEGRSQWRKRKHQIVAFVDEVERYGVERILRRNDAMARALSYVERPMEKVFDEAEETVITFDRKDQEIIAEAGQTLRKAGGNGTPSASNDAWRSNGFAVGAFTPQQEETLRETGLGTLGNLYDRIKRDGTAWANGFGILKDTRRRIEKRLEAFLKEIGAEVNQ